MLINENLKNNIYKIITNENSEQDLDQLSKEDLSKIKKIFSYSRIESYLINNKIFKRFDKETAAFLKNIADKRNINSMTIFKDFIDICKDLQEIDIKIIPLKGLHLNLEFYDDISLRPIRDIDLLLCKNEIKRFLKHLEKKGYFLKNDEKKDLQDIEISDFRYDIPNLINKNNTHLEIHHRIFDKKKVGDLKINEIFLDNIVKKDFTRTNLFFMREEHLLLHIIYHATVKSGFDVGIVALIDAKNIIERYEIDFNYLQKIVKEFNLEKPVYIFLNILENRFNLNIDKEFLFDSHHEQAEVINNFENLIFFNECNPIFLRILEKDFFIDLIAGFSRTAITRESKGDRLPLFARVRKLLRFLGLLIEFLTLFLFKREFRIDIIKTSLLNRELLK